MSFVMTVQSALHALQSLQERGLGALPLVIKYESGKVAIGAAPSTFITGIHAGFDWDSGKVIISTDIPLGVAGDELAAVKKSGDKMAGQVYRVRKILKSDLSAEEKLKNISAVMERKG